MAAKPFDELRDLLTSSPYEFRGDPWYSAAGDCVFWYLADREAYRCRIDDKLTVNRADDDDEIVGCQIKGVHALLNKHGAFSVEYREKGVLLAFLFFVSHFNADVDESEFVSRKPVYDRLIEFAGDRTVSLTDADTDGELLTC